MVGSIAASCAIGLCDGLAAIVAAAAVNRFFQSGGWGGLVHVASRWFPSERRGRVMGILSTSYELGNVVALLLCGAIIHAGLGWRALFRVNPAIFAAAAVFVAIALVPAPPGDAPVSAKTDNTEPEPAPTLREVLPWLAKKPAFWGTLALSALLTFIRTGFLTWTPTYLAEVARAAGSATAISGGIAKSAIFPASGVVAALTVGRISDKLGPGKRTPIMVASLALHVVAVLALAHTNVASPAVAAALIGVCGLFLLGPYSLPAGAMTLDVAGKRAASLTAGFVDGAGYICGSLSGVLLGGAADRWGWHAAFDVVAFAATMALIVAATWWRLSARRAK
jgi:sugar phosphate permease